MTQPVTYHYCSTCSQQFPATEVYDVQGSTMCHGCYAAWQRASQPASPSPTPVHSASRKPPEYGWLRLAAGWFSGIGAFLMLLAIIFVIIGFYGLSSPRWTSEQTIAAFATAFVVFFAGSIYFAMGEAIIALRDIARNSFRLK